MTETLNVGIIGCGNISEAYLTLAPLFNGIKMVACADINTDAANARAAEFGIQSLSIEKLLSDESVDIIVNLTIPAVHAEVSAQVLSAGKHVYSEKPFALSAAESQTLLDIAKEKNLRIGSAPDTFLGGVHQHARELIDNNAIGKVTSGTAHVQGRGMESWHPNPDFFFKPGAGPVLDIGPYYITNLVQLLGPVARVGAISTTPRTERIITSEPRDGETITVETPTTIHSLLAFHSGATITLGTSWDVQHHQHQHMELYGETGTLYVPDPNFFGGEIRMTEGDELIDSLPAFNHPFSVANEEEDDGSMRANYRAAGLADMAMAITEGREHRCSAELATHVVDVMTSILKSGELGEFVSVTSQCKRPAPLSIEDAQALLK